MALFKPFKGNRASLDAQPLHDGYAYFCVDDGSFHIDYVDTSGNLKRKQINAQYAEALTNYSISTILNSSDMEIPTSKAVFDAIANYKHVGKNISGTSHVIDGETVTSGVNAEIFNDYQSNVSIGAYSHTEGSHNTAEGDYSHAEGYDTIAAGRYSHTEGQDTIANGEHAHAEGYGSRANGQAAHAEGYSCQALGTGAHSEGGATYAEGDYSHAEGLNTYVYHEAQHVQGKYNRLDEAGKYAHIVGNGSGNSSRSNAHTIDWDGKGWFAGDVKIGGTGYDDANAKTLATTAYVNTAISNIPTQDASGQISSHNSSSSAHTDIRNSISNLGNLVGDKKVSDQIAAAQLVYVGPTKPTDPNIKVWINTAEEGTGIVPVMPRISTISLPKASWTGSASPYYQTVTINTVTAATKIELNPTVAQIVSLQNDDIALMAENNNGAVKVYSFGGKPSGDITMQVTLMEVSYV